MKCVSLQTNYTNFLFLLAVLLKKTISIKTKSKQNRVLLSLAFRLLQKKKNFLSGIN